MQSRVWLLISCSIMTELERSIPLEKVELRAKLVDLMGLKSKSCFGLGKNSGVDLEN